MGPSTASSVTAGPSVTFANSLTRHSVSSSGTKPGGYVLISVMSTLGTMRTFLPALTEEGRRFGLAHNERIFTTGELDRETNNGHEMKMYRWSELSALCQRHGELVAGAAANFLAASHDPAVFDVLREEESDQLVSFELRLCREPGVLDAGTHILAAIRTPAPSSDDGFTEAPSGAAPE